MEKYGFVYVWYDIKRKMFYIGCHWGTENDGYICSSNRMRDAYRRRPNDFKRRVIKRVYTNRENLLLEEHRYLSMIENEKLGKKYYNLTKHYYGHWSTSEEKTKTIKEKISQKTKDAMWRSEVRDKYLKSLQYRDNKSATDSVREKKSKSMKILIANIRSNGGEWKCDNKIANEANIGSTAFYKNGKRKMAKENTEKHNKLLSDGWMTMDQLTELGIMSSKRSRARARQK